METTTLAAGAINFVEPKAAMSPTRKDSANELNAEPFDQSKGAVETVETVSIESTVKPTAAFVPVPSTSPPSSDKVRIVDVSEYKAAALALAEAFKDDDVSRYFLDTVDRADWTPEQKWDLHVSIFEYVVYAHILKGLVTTVGSDYGAVALWMPPGNNIDDFLTVFRSGMWRLRYRLSREGRKRFFTEFMPLLHDTKASIMGERDATSWYLVYIGTKPSARGKGYCRKLIEHVTDIADQEGRATYLESSNVRNVPIYRRMGFRECRRIYLQRAEEGNVPLDVMVREPGVKEG
ncbi:putative n-acetyltransferase protein [Botryosphaeria dothidea]|uniref:N-acetyltransferase protein n=1 Tax=Botryosphaeria dothidea TaxID=55169 RepID=A0A8H4IVS4_9PEZI|nr:putative n-acetyltransferase protein [Botryosphaeria dothidea]